MLKVLATNLFGTENGRNSNVLKSFETFENNFNFENVIQWSVISLCIIPETIICKLLENYDQEQTECDSDYQR